MFIIPTFTPHSFLLIFIILAHASSNLTASLDIYLVGLRIPFNLPDEALAACQNLITGDCPVEKGDVIEYGFMEKFDGIPVTATVTIEFGLLNDQGEKMVCARFGARVHSSPRPESLK